MALSGSSSTRSAHIRPAHSPSNCASWLPPLACVAQTQHRSDPVGELPEEGDAVRSSGVDHFANSGEIDPSPAPDLILDLRPARCIEVKR